MNRKQRRAAKRELKKQHDVFSKLPDECSACTKEFDKQDRDMVSSWNVVVRQDEQQVRLYCPDCWDAAQTAIKQVYGELNDNV
jgi:predicted RNA-binding Zn-ribbon protein involved in translation (DUF1610 family)